MESVSEILKSYNSVIETDERYREKTGESTRLADEFRYIFERHETELSEAGMISNNNN